MDKKDYQLLPIGKLQLNTGQLNGLPKNPRFIKDMEYEKLKRSIQASPEFLDARMLLVYPLEDGNFVTIAGNMRLRACRELGFKELPCYVFKKETTIEKLREFAIKDNANFGSWDYDILANEDWSDNLELLEEWGAPIDFLKQDEWEDLPIIEEEQADPVLDKPTKIVVSVPVELKDKIEDIKEALKLTCEEWEGVTIA